MRPDDRFMAPLCRAILLSIALLTALPAWAAASFPVRIDVDAAKNVAPPPPDLAVLRRGRAELRDDEGRRETADASSASCAPGTGLFPHAQPAHHRRRHAGVQVGQHQRLHRGRRGQAGLRLDDRRPHLRHVPRARRAALRADRLHAARRCRRTSRSRTSTNGGRASTTRQITTGWAYPPKDYAKWARARLPVGEALRRAVRPRRGGAVVLGGLERGEHAPSTGAARPRSSTSCTTTRSTPCAARCRRRASAARTSPERGGEFMDGFLEHVASGTNYATGRPARRSISSPSTPRARRRSSTATCAWASPPSCATIDDGVREDRCRSRAEGQADRHRRDRSGRLRRLPGAAARLSQRHDVFELHRRQLRAQAGPRASGTA